MYAIEIPRGKTFEIAEIPEYVWYGLEQNSPTSNILKERTNILKTYFKLWKKMKNRRKTAIIMSNMNVNIDILSPPRSSMGSPRSPASPDSDDTFIVSPTQEFFNKFRFSSSDLETKIISALNFIQQYIITYINKPYNKDKPFTNEFMEEILWHCKTYNTDFKIICGSYSDKFWLNYIRMIYINMHMNLNA